MGKVAVVTGGSSGIGLAVVQKMLSQGYDVVNFDIREPSEKLNSEFCQVDITNLDQIQSNMELVKGKYGTLDILINAAGIADNDTPCDLVSDEFWGYVMDINLTGTFYACRAALKIMLPAQKGSIVNISSIAGISGSIGGATYCASKAAVIGLTRSIAHYYGPRGIRANVVCPGLVKTNILQNSKNMTKPIDPCLWVKPDKPKITTEDVPLGRLATPQELAEPIYFLASSAGSYVNGHVMIIDGGWSA